ncbi:DUF3085 domain-containing protein [Pseudomonas simiae]|uniref:DUF3085 domain-containing protein n=1 Tax=Pseudomonas simiae TaxID=321846 RepID=UPI00358F33EE
MVKDHGVYWLAEQGERQAGGRQKLIAYAVGCNAGVDAFDDWWALARNELGGDDLGSISTRIQRCPRASSTVRMIWNWPPRRPS